MPPDCQEFESGLIQRASRGDEGAASDVIQDAELTAHLEGCGSCRELLARRERQVEALRTLARLSAPAEAQELVELGLGSGSDEAGSALRAARALSLLGRQATPRELDGRVVASLHAGYRQERAVDEVGRLERLDPPPVLEEQVLEDQILQEQERARHAELDAGAAPELTPDRSEFVTDDLTRRAMHVGEGTPTIRDRRDWRPPAGRRLARHRAVLGGLAAAALLLAWAGFAGPFGLFDEGARPTRFSFEVIEVSSIQDLSPMGRGLLDSAVGGALTAWEGNR